MIYRLFCSFLVFIFIFLCFGCQTQAQDNEDENREVSSAIAPTQEFVHKGFDISFQAANKSIINTQDLIGKVVFINFWATWCPPCIAEMPSIQILYDKFKDNKDIVFLMVDVDSDLKGAEQFMNSRKFTLPIYIPNSNIPSSFLEGAIPTTVILDKRGNIDVLLEGGRDYTAPQMTQALESLLSE